MADLRPGIGKLYSRKTDGFLVVPHFINGELVYYSPISPDPMDRYPSRTYKMTWLDFLAAHTMVGSATANTNFPTNGTVIWDMDPDVVTGKADGARVTSVPDATNSITAVPIASGVGPKMLNNAANGHKGLQFSNDTTEMLTIGEPTALASAAAGGQWTVQITFMSATVGGDNSKYNAMFGDEYSGGFWMTAGSDFVSLSAGFKRSFETNDPSSNIHTLTFSSETVPQGRAYLDGTMFAAITGTTIHKAGNAFYLGGLMVNGNPFQGFAGTILSIKFVNAAWTAPNSLQGYYWACAKFGKTLPIAGRSFFVVCDGDSQTYGTSTTGTISNINSSDNSYFDNSFPALLARTRGWKLGAYANVGKPSCTVLSGTGGANNNYNMMDQAAKDVDGFAAVTGLPVYLIHGEWYNQGSAGGVASDGSNTANNNRAYAAARATTGVFAKQFLWTSIDTDREGAARDGCFASLVSRHPHIDAVIPVHQDSRIGVTGTYTNRTYFEPPSAQGNVAHCIGPGYAVLASLIDAGLTNAGIIG